MGSRTMQPRLVIGDVHGEFLALETALTICREENRRPVFLGDLTDKGRESVRVLTVVMPLVAGGDADLLLGNHEAKLHKALKEGAPDPNGPRARLVRDLARCEGGSALARLVVDTIEQSPYWLRLEDTTFVHGAFHPSMIESDPRLAVPQALRRLALYGEVQGFDPAGLPVRTYGWIETIPSGHRVVAGHDVRGSEPSVFRNAAGGAAIFLDTGAGKGGPLSAMRFPEMLVVTIDCCTGGVRSQYDLSPGEAPSTIESETVRSPTAKET